MPPFLALAFSLIFSGALLIRETRRLPDVSSAVWFPCLWLVFLSSRAPSQWLGGSAGDTANALMEGNPIDRTVYMILMACALIVLWRRRIAWMELPARNPWLTVFFAYCALSVLWSDFPDVAAKRWMKGLGDPMMAIVLVTEARPAMATISVLKRCAFVLIPLSIVFIKYFPELGRAYDAWSGMAFYTGVTTNKNMLGYLLFVFGLVFACTLGDRQDEDEAGPRADTVITVLFLGMVAWLFAMADSKTALFGLSVAVAIVAVTRVSIIRRHFGLAAVTAIVLAGLLQFFFNIGDSVLAGAGRDATLTGRTAIWDSVLAMRVNPLLGTGFESFWLGDRLNLMWRQFPVFHPVQAHNGYIEMYLNLGWIGLALFAGVLVTSYQVIRRRLSESTADGAGIDDIALARFGIGYLAAYVLYNVTEATFGSLNFLFVIFLTLSIRYPAVYAVARNEVEAPLRMSWPKTPRVGSRSAVRARDAVRPAAHSNVNREWLSRRMKGSSSRFATTDDKR